MPKTICADLINLRKVFKENEKTKEEFFISQLTPELADIYKNAFHTSWIPIESSSEIYKKASEVLFPGKLDGLSLLGRELAKKTFSGIFKIFLIFPTIKYVMSRAANIWRSYYDKGTGSIENITDKSCDFVIRDFPELTKNLRQIAKGHMCVLLESTGAKDVFIHLDETNPNEWRWKISWK